MGRPIRKRADAYHMGLPYFLRNIPEVQIWYLP